MAVSEAWLIDCGENLQIAVSRAEMTEYLLSPVSFAIPGTPDYCSHVAFWQNDFLPIFDLNLLQKKTAEYGDHLLAVLAFQQEPNTPLSHLAIALEKPPSIISVDDDSIIDVPEDLADSNLGSLILSCFQHQDKPILILDIAMLASTTYRDLIN
ncbi:MAG: chemotaxis protein CheW [Gammaproteobacteria bacterium]|nr:chemotaxis protein CheW [Gammaproteobacteria bacterium]